MAARKVMRESTQDSNSFTRPRDSIIDEFPPEETEKMGYVWVVKGTLTDEEEKEAAKFGSMPDISSLPMHEISGCTLAKEKVHELIVPGDYWAEGPAQVERSRATTGEEFRLYIPSFIRRMHSLFSRPPELLRKDSLSLKQIAEQIPAELVDRPSYLHQPSRYLGLIREPGERSTLSTFSKHEEPHEAIQSEEEPPEAKQPEAERPAPLEPEEDRPQEKEEESQDIQPAQKEEINAVYADPEIEWEKPTPEPLKPILLERKKWEVGEPSKMKRVQLPQARRASEVKSYYIREYILKKVEELENRLKRVNAEISGTKDRHLQLQYQFYEMEILRLVEKIARDETPSETDVAKLEYLTDQLKLAQGKKTTEE